MFTAEYDISQRSIGWLMSRRERLHIAFTRPIPGTLVFVEIVGYRGNIWPPELRLTEAIMFFVSSTLDRILILEDRAYSSELVRLNRHLA